VLLVVDYYFQSGHSAGNTQSLAISEPAIGEIMEMAGEDSSIPQGNTALGLVYTRPVVTQSGDGSKRFIPDVDLLTGAADSSYATLRKRRPLWAIAFT
jgi:hypothetical protein